MSYLDGVPVSIVDGDSSEPQVSFFRAQAVEIEAESQPAVFNLRATVMD